MKHTHSIGITGYLFIGILSILAYVGYLRYQQQPHYIEVYNSQNWQAFAYNSAKTVNYKNEKPIKKSNSKDLLLSFESSSIDLSRPQYKRFMQALKQIQDQTVELQILFSSYQLNSSENQVQHQQKRVQRIAQTAYRYTRSITMQACKDIENNRILIKISPKTPLLKPIN